MNLTGRSNFQTRTVLFVLPVILLLTGKIVSFYFNEASALILLGAYLSFVIFVIFLILDTSYRYFLYLAVLISYLILAIAGFFVSMHWYGGGILKVLGLSLSLIAPFLLIWKSLKNEKGGFLLLQFLAGILLLLQLIVFPGFSLSKGLFPAQLLNYPIAAVTATILINRTELNPAERNILSVILLSAVFFIIKSTFRLFSEEETIGRIEKILRFEP